MHFLPLALNAMVKWHSATDEADLSLSTALAGICYSRRTRPGRSAAVPHLGVPGHFVLPGLYPMCSHMYWKKPFCILMVSNF